MHCEALRDALCAAETVVDKALNSCESNAATRSFAPPILLSILMKILSPFLAPCQTGLDGSADSLVSRASGIYTLFVPIEQHATD